MKVAGSERPRLCEIPVGCALWISEKQARELYKQDCHFFDYQEKRDTSPFREEHEFLCMHGGPGSPNRHMDNGDADSQHSYKSSESFRRSADSEYSGSPGVARRRGRSSGARGHGGKETAALLLQNRQCILIIILLLFQDTESNHSDGSSVLEKRSQTSSRRSRNNSSAAKRPMWQYWGRAQIPDILDPPSHEPYMPMQVLGPVALVNSQREFKKSITKFSFPYFSCYISTDQNRK